MHGLGEHPAGQSFGIQILHCDMRETLDECLTST
jgi:hypothetical protein